MFSQASSCTQKHHNHNHSDNKGKGGCGLMREEASRAYEDPNATTTTTGAGAGVWARASKVPSAFRRKLHYSLVCTSAFLLAWAVFVYGGQPSLFSYLLPLLALVFAQPTLGDALLVFLSNAYVTLLVAPLGFACSLLSFSLPLLMPAVFLVLVVVLNSSMSILQKKGGMLIFLIAALNPLLAGASGEADILWSSLQRLPSVLLMQTAPCIPGIVAALIAIPSLATFRIKQRLKFLQYCTEGTINAIMIGFANQDIVVADIDQLLDQVDRSITACSTQHAAMMAELLLTNGSLNFGQQVKEFLQIMRDIHGVLSALAWTIKDIQPNKTHKLFFPYLDSPLRELGQAMMDVLQYTMNTIRQEPLFPCSGSFRQPVQHKETPPGLMRLKIRFFNEYASVPPVPLVLNDAIFDRLAQCVINLRQKYTEARLHILYGVLIEDVELDSDVESTDHSSHEADFPKPSRQSRLVSVDPEIFEDQERFGFMNIFARGTFVHQMSVTADAFMKLKSVVRMHYEPPTQSYWHALCTVTPANVLAKPNWPGWVRLRQPLKVAGTITVAALFTVLPGAKLFQQPLWALFTVCFIIGEFSASSFTTGLLRVQGTVIGAMYGYFVRIVAEKAGLWFLVLAVSVWVFLTSFSRQSATYGYSALVAGFTAIVVTTSGADAQETAWNRIISTLFGVVLFLVVDNVIYPMRSDDRLRQKVYQSTSLIKDFLDDIDVHLSAVVRPAPVTAVIPVAAPVPLFDPDLEAANGEKKEEGDAIRNVPARQNTLTSTIEDTETEDLPIELFLGSFNPSLPRERIFVPRRELVQGQLHVLFVDLQRLLTIAGDEPELWRRPFPGQAYAKLIVCMQSLTQLLVLLQSALGQFPLHERTRSFTRTALHHVQTLRSEAVDALDEALQVMADLQARRRPHQVVALLALRTLSLTIERYITTDCRDFIHNSLHHPALRDSVVLPFNATVYSMTRIQKELLRFGYVLREIVACESGSVYF